MPPVRPSLSPLLKWTGGKRREIPFLKPSYPADIRRVVEPFSGGAAVAFDLNPDRIVLNDLNTGLLRFYRSLGDASRRQPFLDALATVDTLRKRVRATFLTLGQSQERTDGFFKNPLPIVEEAFEGWLAGLAWPDELVPVLKKDMLGQLTSKVLGRIPALEAKNGQPFTAAERAEHGQTAVQAGIYTTLRRLYNGHAAPEAWILAAWWLVRALCYSGMFRYSANGQFNVPYGGIAYNSRDFASSQAQLQNPDLLDFFARSSIHELDFQALFEHYGHFGDGDFVFVDPPYDSAFSQYNPEGDFTADDQRRLAAQLKQLKCPWMLVIKNTAFIYSLYENEGLVLGAFGKTYGVNFRNRHDRGVEHLVVTNYPQVWNADGTGLQLAKRPSA